MTAGTQNPYQAPSVAIDPPAAQLGGNVHSGVWGYQSARGAASVTKVFLYINAGIAALGLITAAWAAVSMGGSPRTLAGVGNAATSLMAYGMISIVEIIGRLACAIPFCIWFYRAYANLRGLGNDFTAFAPGWAPGSFFVPFLNLVRPQQIAREIWTNSSTDEASTNWGIVNRWWGFWIGGNIIAYVGSRVIGAGSFSAGLWIVAAASGLLCAAAITAASMVGRVERRQSDMAETLAQRAQQQAAA